MSAIRSNLDASQVLRNSHDETSQSLFVRNVSDLLVASWDYMALVLTNATTETYTFKTGGAAGTTTGTITIVYTDSTKATLSTVTRT